jgi:hypothetical protein
MDRQLRDKPRHLNEPEEETCSKRGYFATRRKPVRSNASISQVLIQLEERVEHHRERQAFYAEQEKIHREQAEHHATALEAALAHLEAFRAAADAAGDLLERDKPAAPPPGEPEADAELDNMKRPLSRLVARVVEGKAPEEIFGPGAVAREVQRRWGANLRRKVNLRSVATTLRRMALAGRIHQVREGRPNYESLYSKTVQKAAPG